MLKRSTCNALLTTHLHERALLQGILLCLPSVSGAEP